MAVTSGPGVTTASFFLGRLVVENGVVLPAVVEVVWVVGVVGVVIVVEIVVFVDVGAVWVVTVIGVVVGLVVFFSTASGFGLISLLDSVTDVAEVSSSSMVELLPSKS